MNDVLKANLPHLERYAMHLTRDRSEAEDLVQDCLERALLKKDLFEAGSNYRAWLFAIMHNVFLNKVRRNRAAARYVADLTPRLSWVAPPAQQASLMLSRTLDAVAALSEEERDALLGAANFSYKEITASTGVPIGTIKSRVSRARTHLRRALTGSEANEAIEL